MATGRMEKKLMTFNITEYKKSILGMFHELTEIEMQASIDTAKSKPEQADYATIYNLAVKQCRNILDAILKDK